MLQIKAHLIGETAETLEDLGKINLMDEDTLAMLKAQSFIMYVSDEINI